ncbi:MAG: cytochrome c3 family protein [Bacteroidales bacterium]
MIQLLKGEVLRHLSLISILLAFTFVGHSSAFTPQDTLSTDTAIQPATLTQSDTTMVADSLPVTSATPTMHSDHLLRGERLFYGLVYFADRAVNCAACHTIHQADTMNWNPGAAEIAIKYLDKSSDELEAVLLRPTGEKMAEAHASIDLTSQDVVMIKGFMDHIAIEGIKKPKPIITRLLLFIFFSLLFLFSIVDLVFLKLTKRKWILLLTLLISATYITDTLVREAIAVGRSQFYQPDQPIKFSHMVHATQNQTECLYCHTTAEYSHSAGIPSVNHCMNCHIIVRDGTNSGRFEIAKVVDAFDNEMPIRWIRVHNLPHHVAFPHDQHVGVVGVDCAECHGEVEKMDKVMQVNDLSMGWCLDCHRTREMDIMRNDFYSVYLKLREDVLANRTDMVTARMTGGTECMKCHY